MSDSPNACRDGSKRERQEIRLANLEAEVAYFQARLEILGEPVTANQQAQSKTFKLLFESLGSLILETRQRMIDAG